MYFAFTFWFSLVSNIYQSKHKCLKKKKDAVKTISSAIHFVHLNPFVRLS